MIRFLADENFNHQIVRGILRQNSQIDFAYERLESGLFMPGLFEVSRRVPVGLAIEEILLIAECSLEGDWEGQVRFLPLR
jgi:hypothetical protein